MPTVIVGYRHAVTDHSRSPRTGVWGRQVISQCLRGPVAMGSLASFRPPTGRDAPRLRPLTLLLAVAALLLLAAAAVGQDEELAPVPPARVLQVEKWYLQWTVTIDGAGDTRERTPLLDSTSERTHWVIEGGATLDSRHPNDPPPGTETAVDQAALAEFLKALPPQARAQIQKLPPEQQAALLRQRSSGLASASWGGRWDPVWVTMQESFSGTFGDVAEILGEFVGSAKETWAAGRREMGFHVPAPTLWVDAEAQKYWLSMNPDPRRGPVKAAPWTRRSQVVTYDERGKSESKTTTEDLTYDVRWPDSWRELEGGLDLLGDYPLWTYVARGASLGDKWDQPLTGRRVYPAKWDDGRLMGTVEITWTCSTRPPDPVELLVDVEGYDSWMPEGNLDDPDEPGGSVRIKASLVSKKDGKKPKTQRAEAFSFELIEVSQEPGVCLNWPARDSKPPADPDDLRFVSRLQESLASVEPGTRRLVDRTGPGTEATAMLSSFDFGGYGLLRVRATLDDGTELVGHLAQDPAVCNIPLPKRDGGSYIAKGWRPVPGGDRWDGDRVRGDLHPGDGLSQYEEYRGFVVSGAGGGREHRRTEPKRKTLLVHTNVSWAGGGLRTLERAAGLQVLRVDQPGYVDNQTRLVNFNHGAHHVVDQHGLYVMARRGLGAGASAPGPPRFVASVEVTTTPDTRTRQGATLARELAVALGVPDHGDGMQWRYSPDGTNPYGFIFPHCLVTCPRSEHSGVQNCIMRWNFADYIERVRGDPRTLVPYGPREPDGTILCSGNQGTGVNAGGAKCGNAAEGRGNCLVRVKVCDLYPQTPW